MIIFSAILPHPPLSIPGVGNEKSRGCLSLTSESLLKISEEFWGCDPETIIIVSPHGKIEPYNFVINEAPFLVCDFSRYHLPKQIEFFNDMAIVEDIKYACEMNEIPIHGYQGKIDHGTFIPLWHLYSNSKAHFVRLVQISFSLLEMEKHFEFGKILGKIFDQYHPQKRIAVIASADLSHKLTFNAPAGYSPEAKYFDQKIIDVLKKRDIKRLIDFKKSDSIEAAECGLRSIVVILAIIDCYDWKFRFFSYEYPFGVGHLVARLI